MRCPSSLNLRQQHESHLHNTAPRIHFEKASAWSFLHIKKHVVYKAQTSGTLLVTSPKNLSMEVFSLSKRSSEPSKKTGLQAQASSKAWQMWKRQRSETSAFFGISRSSDSSGRHRKARPLQLLKLQYFSWLLMECNKGTILET